MEENKPGRTPDYKGEGIAIWVNQDKNGNPYLSVKILGAITVNCFKNIPRPKPTPNPEEIQI